MCNFLKKGENFQTLDKHLNIKLAFILKIKHTERIGNQFAIKWYKNQEFSHLAVVKNNFLMIFRPTSAYYWRL